MQYNHIHQNKWINVGVGWTNTILLRHSSVACIASVPVRGAFSAFWPRANWSETPSPSPMISMFFFDAEGNFLSVPNKWAERTAITRDWRPLLYLTFCSYIDIFLYEGKIRELWKRMSVGSVCWLTMPWLWTWRKKYFPQPRSQTLSPGKGENVRVEDVLPPKCFLGFRACKQLPTN